MPLLRPCAGCDELVPSGTRHDHRNRGRRATDTAAWQRRRAREVAAHVARYGWVCPGWRRPPHPSRRLTLDHLVPMIHGGEPFGDTRVLCDECNSARREGAVE